MLEYFNVHVNDIENKSFYVRLSLSESDVSYMVETGMGKGGLYITWAAPNSGVETNIKYGEIKEGDRLSFLLEQLIKPLVRGKKRYPTDYEKDRRIMGSPENSFSLDFRMEGRVNTHHIYGKLSMMPETIWVILRLFADIGIITEDQILDLEVEE